MDPRLERCAALVLFSSDLQATGAFYRALGVELREQKFADGPVFLTGRIGDLELVIDPASASGRAAPRWSNGATQLSFAVEHVEEAIAAALLGGGSVDVKTEITPFGRRAIVLDPDGRPVELLEPSVPAEQ